MSLKEKLAQAGQKAEKQEKERRAKVVKGAHLTETLLEAAKAAGLNVVLSKSGAFHVITGAAGKAKRIYLAAKGGTVDFSGFTVEADAVKQFTEDEAKRMHLGKVRGRIDFEASDEDVIAAFKAALAEADVPVPPPVKTPRAPRVPRTKPEAETATQPSAE